MTAQFGETGPLSVRSDREAGRLTLRFAGELDAQTADLFSSAVEDAESSDPVVTVLDLIEVRFIDSTGLVALLMAARRAERDGRALQVRAGSGEVRQLLELTAIDQRLDLID